MDRIVDIESLTYLRDQWRQHRLGELAVLLAAIDRGAHIEARSDLSLRHAVCCLCTVVHQTQRHISCFIALSRWFARATMRAIGTLLDSWKRQSRMRVEQQRRRERCHESGTATETGLANTRCRRALCCRRRGR